MALWCSVYAVGVVLSLFCVHYCVHRWAVSTPLRRRSFGAGAAFEPSLRPTPYPFSLIPPPPTLTP